MTVLPCPAVCKCMLGFPKLLQPRVRVRGSVSVNVSIRVSVDVKMNLSGATAS